MSSEKKLVGASVDALIDELKKNPSTRFSKSDYQMLVYAVLSDKDFKAKKYVIRNDKMFEETMDHRAAMLRFLDKLLKHAGFSNVDQRQNLLDTFEYNSRDLEWVSDAVDEAMAIYTDCGKSMRVFREKMLQLSVRKIVRSGKYAGKVTYKKSVVDRALTLEKRLKKGE